MTVAQTETPEGFRDVKAEESTGARVDRTALSGGVVLQFRGSRMFAKRGGGTTTVHIFLARAGKGVRFSVFGSAQLDSKLKTVKPGSIVWLLYRGKRDIDGQETHDWNVSDAGLRANPVNVETLMKNSESQHRDLDAAVMNAVRENESRRQSGDADQAEWAPIDDDDRPNY